MSSGMSMSMSITGEEGDGVAGVQRAGAGHGHGHHHHSAGEVDARGPVVDGGEMPARTTRPIQETTTKAKKEELSDIRNQHSEVKINHL
jgi:hypothetical protein